ncbi:MAG TPA: class I SAM-dependent methyltransferase, partial [Anaerolineales bacterium]|nr:class I SAM-dependent methyltransferase [Anaerolineales bacterium]
YEQGYSPYTPGDIECLLADLLPAALARKINWLCEVGSADGQISFELLKRMPQAPLALGIDIAERVLRLYPFHRLCGDAFKLPLADSTVDLVCYPATLHHLFPFEYSLAELNRVLAPNGLVYFLEPNYFHPQRRFFMSNRFLYHLYRQANDTPINPERLKDVLESMGIEVLQLRYINLHFKSPGFLQSIQNFISGLPCPAWLERIVMPWFIMIGVKRDTHAR